MSLASQDPDKHQISRPARRRLGTAKIVSDMLALPLTSVYDHARSGELPGVVRIGHRVLFDLDKLEAWIDAGGNTSRGPEPQ